MTTRANRIERYYDSHEVEGEELTQSLAHFAAIQYLINILQWLFTGQRVGIASNVNFYQTDQPDERPTSPDLVVVDGLVLEERTADDNPSYYIGEDGPPPRLAIEVSSKETWAIDLRDKPARYARLGIAEYIAFDPNRRTVWAGQWRNHGRLLGWRLDPATGLYVQIEKSPDSRLWSEQLNSWLAVEGQYLRLYTAQGELRVGEAEAQASLVEHERRRAEDERQRAEKLAALLRQYGEDPDKIT